MTTGTDERAPIQPTAYLKAILFCVRIVVAIGSVITTVCCFTPALIWILGVVGITVAIAYFDVFLLPLLGTFILMLGYGVYRCKACRDYERSLLL